MHVQNSWGRTQLQAIFLCVYFVAGLAGDFPGWARPAAAKADPAHVLQSCARPLEGALMTDPAELRSKDGHLEVQLQIRNSPDPNGNMRYCYFDQNGHQSPTLRLQPGDTLSITLSNKISLAEAAGSAHAGHAGGEKRSPGGVHDPCAGGPMSAAATNLHFHGLSIPPVCHQDETLKTLIEPGDPPFTYRIQIPRSQPPGLYWYHPHVHGFTEDHMLGGASGALIIEGMERAVPRVAGLPEHLFVVRDEKMPAVTGPGKPDPMRPTKQLSVNYVPVPYPNYPTPTVKMKPGERQFWRVLNASADTYLNLSLEFGAKRQSLGLVALDGVPLHFGEPGSGRYAVEPSNIFLPPASRAEFVITGPPQGVVARLVTSFVYRGASDDDHPVAPRPNSPAALRAGQDDVDSARPLVSILADPDAVTPAPVQVAAGNAEPAPGRLAAARPVRKRKLYFSEKLVDPNDPRSATLFFITEDGRTPQPFDPNRSQPTIIVQQGDVEDWIIENRSNESHAFHIHQLHFLVVGGRGTNWEEPTLRDTVDLPAWDGVRPYPSITVRLDFRNPDIVGIIPFHCHIMQHLDGGMMGTLLIKPKPPQVASQ